mmetsp:Transcript_11426/g.34340  ORF Transcript_11426/g.34340 Transcript_11426/m.34340 type:complete len:460 (+) Transcript_11426:89-1468(+)
MSAAGIKATLSKAVAASPAPNACIAKACPQPPSPHSTGRVRSTLSDPSRTRTPRGCASIATGAAAITMELSTAASLHVNDSTATAETLLTQRMPTADGTSAYPAATTATDGYGGAELSVSPAVAKAALDLQTHGWAVVEDVIPYAECKAYIDRVWGWLEGLGTGIKRNDPSSWSDDRWPPAFGNGGNGIVKRLEVAHQDFVWKMRSDPRITAVFAALWGTDALLSSFDSINVMRPPAATGQAPGAAWWHTDQAPRRNGLECIQGLLNLTPCGLDAGTVMVRHNSHREHADYWANKSRMDPAEKAAMGDFYIFKPEEVGYWDCFKALALNGYGPGSLILWDSRTVHQNRPPSDPQLWRHVLYTCYQPAALATEKDLDKKRQAYEQYLITTHWPAKNVTLGEPNTPEEEARFSMPRNRHLVEDDTILRLAGVQRYDPALERRCVPLLLRTPRELRALAGEA